MGDVLSVEGTPGKMNAERQKHKKQKRSLDTFLRDTERDYHDHDQETPAKRPYCCSESLSSRITDWLSQLPPENSPEAEVFDPEMGLFGKDKKDKGKGKSKSDSSVVGGLDTPARSGPPSVASGASRPVTATGTYHSSASTGRPVERPDYRDVNLKQNGIYYLDSDKPLPAHVSEHCKTVGKPRTSPEPTPEELSREIKFLRRMQHDGALEGEVEAWFNKYVFPGANDICEDGLAVRYKPTFQHGIPNGPTPNKVSKPIPDLVYGYTTTPQFTKFSEPQFLAGEKMDPPMGKVVGNGDLSFPFFVIEFKGAGPANGNLWVATNQCLGGSAACVETADRLHRLLKQYSGAKTVDNTSFSMAMDQDTVKLYVSWRGDELKYYTRDVRYSFNLEKPEDYLLFRRYVKNILDWGKGPRLEEIQTAFDHILEEDRKAASARAKQRPAPSSASGGSAPFKHPSNAPAGSPSVASRASSSRTQSDNRSSASSSKIYPPAGYRSASAAASSGSKSYQPAPVAAPSGSTSYPPGSYAGGGSRSGSGSGSGSGLGPGSGSGGGRDRSPRPPDRYAQPPRHSGSPPRPDHYAQRLNPPSRDPPRGDSSRKPFADAYGRR